MNFYDSRLFRVVETLVNFLLLNLLWLLVSLPVITFFPATTALFGVLSAWEEREGAGIVGPFFTVFREKFWQSLIIGVAWVVVGGVLLVDFLASQRIGGLFGFVLLVASGSLGLAFWSLTAYLFPMIARARTTPLGILRNVGLLVLSQPFLSLLTAFGLLIYLFAIYVAPFMLLLTGSFIAYGLLALFRRAIGKFPPAPYDRGERVRE